MDFGVLVLAMSTLSDTTKSTYHVKQNGQRGTESYQGIGQLEVVPLYLTRGRHEHITHIVLMETDEVVKPQQFGRDQSKISPEDTCAKIRRDCPKDIDWEGVGSTISASEFFVRRMSRKDITPTYVRPDVVLTSYEWPSGTDPQLHYGIPLDPDDLPTGLETLQMVIRELYRQYLESKREDEASEWKLWLDAHGAFREVSLAMFGLVQMLAAPDEQELLLLEPDLAKRDALQKRFGDGKDTVPVTGVYTVNYNPSRHEGDIIDQTEFYRTFIGPAITEYLNYGQYAQMFLRSDAQDGEGNYLHPYAFVSYRRSDSAKERFAFLGALREGGFRYWYDDAIEPEARWADRLREANENCDVFIAIVTRGYYESFQCVKEMRQALDNGKPIYLVSPDKTPLYAPDCGIRVLDSTSDEELVIYQWELADLAKRQHLPLDILMVDGVFQPPELRERLSKLFAGLGNSARAHAGGVAVPPRALTHAGVFHADDVFATALLRILNPAVDVTRSNVVPEGFEGIVYDVGGGEFDHHQGEAKRRENGVQYSSFGLLWERFGTTLLAKDDARILDADLVQPIDLADNTGEANPLSLCVSDFNPLHAATPEEFDEAFWKAVPWAQAVLERRLESLRSRRAQFDHVRELADAGDGRVLVLDTFVRWKHALVGTGYEYVIYPSLRGGFNVQCVPERLGDGSMVCPFPEEWRGKPADELQRMTGVSGFQFCHASGFLCAVDSLDGAREVARLAAVSNGR